MVRCGLSESIRFPSCEIGLVQMFSKTTNLLSIQISLSLATITGYKRVMTKSTDNNNKIKQPKISFCVESKIHARMMIHATKANFSTNLTETKKKTHRRNETIENFIIMDSHEYDRLLLA